MNQVPATEKQRRFISELLDTRMVTGELGLAALASDLNIKDASEVIGKLLKCPKQVAVPVAHVNNAAPDIDGMYRDPASGEIFKVQYNRAQGDGRRAYAKRLVIAIDAIRDTQGHIEEPAVVRFDYAPGVLRHIQPEWKMTLEQAKAFGALYGTCCVCGRTLTNERSIELGIGPICRGRLA